MEKTPDFIIWAYGRALKLQAASQVGMVSTAKVEQTNIIPRAPSIPELAGLGIGRRKNGR